MADAPELTEQNPGDQAVAAPIGLRELRFVLECCFWVEFLANLSTLRPQSTDELDFEPDEENGKTDWLNNVASPTRFDLMNLS